MFAFPDPIGCLTDPSALLGPARRARSAISLQSLPFDALGFGLGAATGYARLASTLLLEGSPAPASAPSPAPADADHADDKPLQYTSLRKDYQVPKYPIVLCHGFSGFDRLIYIPALSASTGIGSRQTRKDKTNAVLEHKMVKEDDQEIMDSDTQQKVVAARDDVERPGEQPAKKRQKTSTHSSSAAQTDVYGDVYSYDSNQEDNGIELFEYWNGIKDALEDKGCRVIVAKVPPFASIETRAGVLNKFIQDKVCSLLERTGRKSNDKIKINLVAHSMGGLDCRYLIDRLEKQNYEVVSLTTISTPHRGTYAADFVVENAPNSFIKEYFPSIIQLTRKYMAEKNPIMPNSSSVKYFSWGASASPRVTSMYYIPWKLIKAKEGPNDGMVSLQSAKWGKYMGHIEGVDHKDLINWVGGTNRMKSALGIGKNNFNPIAFYMDIADNIAKNDC